LSLREFVREHRVDLPTMLITHNSINLERPSMKSRSTVEKKIESDVRVNEHESSILKQMKNELNLNDQSDEVKKKKKKKSGVNPLSVKKKNKKIVLKQQQKSIEKKKRRRTRQIRMSKHLKEHLNQLQKHFSIKQFLNVV